MLSVDHRLALLLEDMTLEEKVAQLGSRWAGNDMAMDSPHGENPEDHPGHGRTANTPDPELTFKVAPLQDVFAASGSLTLAEASVDGLGQLTRVFGSVPLTVEEGVAELLRQHRVVLAGSRLGIPALVHEECLTGFTTFGATVYPAAIAWAATFDPELVQRMAAAIGQDMAAVGVHQGLSPVLDVVRDYRWGRVEETLGEDPYLVSMLGSAYVTGLQSAGVIATLKHFAGYSASRGARNHGPVPMGRRELLDVILPPFEMAVSLGGARSVMNSYAEIDGVAAGADPWLLTELLRDEWGFTGTVVSDYWAVPFLATMHRLAEDAQEAGVLALRAGLDVELPDTLGFGPHLVQRVRRGEISESLVDRAAGRLLRQKIELGLLDPQWTPEGSVAEAMDRDLDSASNRAIARELAERSVILLDPGTALPLQRNGSASIGRLAVIGPCADDPRTFMGCYAFPNHVLPRYPARGLGIEVPSALAALRDEFGGATVTFEQGCAIQGDDRSGFPAAISAAREADVCVAFVGDLAGLFGLGTSGEGCDAADLRLPGVQADLIAELIATGTPVVVVVVSGRPYALGEVHDGAAGLIQAFMPGEEGGAAIAGVLSGRIQPSGRLPVQIPRSPGGQPGTYLQPPLGADHSGTSNLDPTPLFAFGHGRSYTTFDLDDLRISHTEIPTDGELTATVRVSNTGGRDGDEVVQLYLRDAVAQVTRPVRQLVGFARAAVPAGGSVDVIFRLHADRTAFAGRDLARIVEPGIFVIMVGLSASDIRCTSEFRLTGPLRTVGHDRVLVTPVLVTPVLVTPVDAPQAT
ncbi:glycoside hydrolase family 3 N-terminal domain-containing protein [Nakamurella sp. UYEF19]|uniref:glycoside hydrolase family 3 N-terminal domain-containing protein n=1 Tax=Nakamurella sp. UYEF19 TaxID=1756392 RepID=UPI003396C110